MAGEAPASGRTQPAARFGSACKATAESMRQCPRDDAHVIAVGQGGPVHAGIRESTKPSAGPARRRQQTARKLRGSAGSAASAAEKVLVA